MINGRPIKLSYAAARRWFHDDESPAISAGSDAKYDVLIELPEIPNIKPPPPTDAMLVKMLTNNSNGAAALVDAYGNAYENPMFSNDPVYQVGERGGNEGKAAVQAQQRKRMKRMGQKVEEEVEMVEVPSDRERPLDIAMENKKYLKRALEVFDMPSLSVPRL